MTNKDIDDYNKKVLNKIRKSLNEVKTFSLSEYTSTLEKELKNQTMCCEVFDINIIPKKEQ